MKKIKKAFSMIEIIIAIFIFSLGLASVFLLINSSLSANLYNKNQLVASNLARENIELFRNIRDNNYKQEKPWNLKNPARDSYGAGDKFSTGAYKLENDFSLNGNMIIDYIVNISNKDSYKLCLNSSNYYTYDCSTSSGNTKTNFYRYLKIEDVVYNSGGTDKTINDAYKITSKVYWYDKGLHDVEIKTIVADFIRL